MKARKIRQGIYWMGAIDWDRRLFDDLISLPEGTTYNAYLVRGSEKTALLDTVDPSMTTELLTQLEAVPNIDYVVSQHAEQDHSGAIPLVLKRYPNARVMATPRGKGLLVDLLDIPEDRIVSVADGETLSLGDRTLRFIYTPWVHWPDTMVTYLPGDNILFTGDFFGRHLATTDLYSDEGHLYEAAKRFYAQIMMPFRVQIQRHLEKLQGYDIDLIAPSHGPLYAQPSLILEAYHDWVWSDPKNLVALPFTSMHDSTLQMVRYLVGALSERGVQVEQFHLPVTDIGKLAMALVDAATIVLGTPTVLGGAHPSALYAAALVNLLRPKARFFSIIGSYGWGGRTGEQLSSMLSNLKAETLPPVLCRGLPRKDDFAALENLAAAIAQKHQEHGFI